MKRYYWPNEDWISAVENEKEIKEINNVIEERYKNLCGIMVIKNGYSVYENYFNGHKKEDTYHMTSVTKSVISALIGIAIDKGYIKGVNEKIFNYFPDYTPNNHIQEKLTIKDLLTMTVPYEYEDWKEPFEEMCRAENMSQYILSICGKNGQLGKFKYSSGGVHLLSNILTTAVGKNAREFANDNLFGMIGMRKIPHYDMEGWGFEEYFGSKVRGWTEDRQGNSTGGFGLTLNLRDMARFGFLYLNNGQWNDKKIISEQYIKDSVKMNPNKYGYLWWLNEDNGLKKFLAMGDGGNVICCIPERHMVIAIAAQFVVNAPDITKLINEYLLNL